jgi:hypothetical protein
MTVCLKKKINDLYDVILEVSPCRTPQKLFSESLDDRFHTAVFRRQEFFVGDFLLPAQVGLD